MFAIRGFAISLSVFFFLYFVLSLAVVAIWRRVSIWSASYPANRRADLLYGLRIAPCLVAIAVTLAFTLPSFLLLEPRSATESMGPIPVLLSFFAIVILLVGTWKAVAAFVRTSRIVKRWASGARELFNDRQEGFPSVSVRLTSANAPPLTAAGIFRSEVWLSRAAQFVLTERELKCAVRHEVAHIRQRDNFRKLVLRLLPFPGMNPLESAWRAECEMAADDAAVSSVSEALDLAAALIKLSRLANSQPIAELATGLLHSPAQSVNARVERLLAWTQPEILDRNGSSFAYACIASAAALAALALTYSSLLVRVHAATEWLVR